MRADEERFLHSPGAPDMSKWPLDVPWIMNDLQRRRLTVVHAGDLSNAEVYDMVGGKWMHRALRAEAHLREAVASHAALMRFWKKIIRKLTSEHPDVDLSEIEIERA